MRTLLLNPWRVIASWVALLVAGIVVLPGIQFSSDNRVFFAQDDPSYVALRDLEAKYTRTNRVLVTLHTEDGDFSDSRHLLTALELHEALWSVPHVTRIDSLVNYKAVSGADDLLASEALVSPDTIMQGRPSRIEIDQVVASDATVAQRLISKDYKTLGYTLSVALPDAPERHTLETVMAQLAVTKARFLQRDGYQLHFSGMVPLMAAFGEAALRDMQLLIPIGLGVAGIVVSLLLVSVRFSIGVLLVAGGSALLTIALWAMAGHVFNTATVVAPIIVMTLTIAAGLHLVVAIRATKADDPIDRIHTGLQMTLKPSGLALITTLVSFLAFSFADAPPLQVLGWMVCTGLVIAYLSLYTVMPCLMSLIQLPNAPSGWLKGRPLAWLVDHQVTTAIVCLLVFLVSFMGLFRLELDDDFTRYFDRSFEYRVASEFASKHLTGQIELQVDIPHPAQDEVTDPEYVVALGEIVAWLRAETSVVNVFSYLDPLGQVARSIPERNGVLPTEQMALAEYVLLYEMSLDPGESLSDFLSLDRTSARVTVVLDGLSSAEIREFIDRLDERLKADEYFNHSSIVGLSELFAHLSLDNVRSMVVATALSVSLIGILLGFVLRSAKLGMASLIMGLVPLLTGFGIWGGVSGTIGLPGAVIVAVTIGVLLDDTIHFIHRYQFARSTRSHRQAVRYAFTLAGEAIVVTTIALIAGFSVLYLSGFLINAQLGILSCLVFGLALMFCLGLLPWLLGLFNTDGTDGDASLSV
ncbi:MAG: MMPL family transporter [Pseudomonadota bacterium]